MLTATGLGSCTECHGPLCVRGRAVACERCGHVVPDHPLTAGWAQLEAVPPPAFAIPPQDYAATHGDRLLALERLAAAQGERLAALERGLAELRKSRSAGK